MRITLPGGCQCSAPSIYPKNYKTSAHSIKVDWYIQFRFFDPVNAPNGKRIIVKGGINAIKDWKERTYNIKLMLEKLTDRLKEGFNPITNITISDEPTENLPFNKALDFGLQSLSVDPMTKKDISNVITWVKKAVVVAGFARLPVKEVSKKHIRKVLEHVAKLKPETFSDNLYNHYLKYLQIVFTELSEQEIVIANPVKDIKRRKVVKKPRPVLTSEEREKIKEFLTQYPDFARFVHIFFHSGGRIRELCRLQGKHVNLGLQQFRTLIKKGKNYRWVERTIKDVALPYWIDQMKDCDAEDYVFSKNLTPGPKPIRAEQITRRWRTHIKQKLGITADLYSLKHLNTDETAALTDIHTAAQQNAHTSPVITLKHYAFGESDRKHEKLKKIGNKF